jgi:hypothetical protein
MNNMLAILILPPELAIPAIVIGLAVIFIAVAMDIKKKRRGNGK